MRSLKLTELPAGHTFTWSENEIPPEHTWAFVHLISHDCGSLALGKSIYSLDGIADPPERDFTVSFEIDVSAPTVVAAARRAWSLLTDAYAMRPVAEVFDKSLGGELQRVDLQEVGL